MLNVPDFQKAAKDFRAGKLDIKQFTRLMYATSDTAPSPAKKPDGVANVVANVVDRSHGPTAPERSHGPSVVDRSHGPTSSERSHGPNVVDRSHGPTEPQLTTPASVTGTEATERINLDLERARRCGYPEVIYGPGKSARDLNLAAQRLLSERQDVLITRLDVDEAMALLDRFPTATYNEAARTFRISAAASDEIAPVKSGKVAVLTAGTGDIPIAEEACETLRWMGFAPTSIHDIGVAGPQRLLRHVPFLQTCDVIVVVAGMEGALPSVVGGHVACPVIAVPTSLGYGAHFQGLVPLLGMLNSCAANVIAVNIDAGFKGGFVAGLILGQLRASV